MAADTSQHSVRAQNSSTPGPSTIGEDLTITGNVTSKGELHIDGRIEGDVHCASLVLGENSQIEGNVIAEDVVIRGRLIGSVRGVRVMLQSTAHVEGNVLHKDLAMEQGAYFEGESRRSTDPVSADRTTQEDQVATKPQRVAERSERRRDKPSTTFVRSLHGSDSI